MIAGLLAIVLSYREPYFVGREVHFVQPEIIRYMRPAHARLPSEFKYWLTPPSYAKRHDFALKYPDLA